MIIYFSGTGNSRHVADLLGQGINEDVERLVENPPLSLEFRGSSFGIVFPVYSWGVPPIVIDYIRNLNEKFVAAISNVPVWIIAVCGDETGEAPFMLKRALAERGVGLCGGWSVQMPNNYVLLPGFDVDSKEVEKEKLEKYPAKVKEISEMINAGKWGEDYVIGPMPRIKSRIVYPLFKRWGIFPSKWRHTDACVSCGMCASACPVDNIIMVKGEGGRVFPKWGNNCTSCVACYHVCPRHAVEYGNITRNKGQYFYK